MHNALEKLEPLISTSSEKFEFELYEIQFMVADRRESEVSLHHIYSRRTIELESG
jgi:hypothetical protein